MSHDQPGGGAPSAGHTQTPGLTLPAPGEPSHRLEVDGGASTVRILPATEAPLQLAETLFAFGCRVEMGPGGMLAASIGADCPREGIMEWLDGLESEGAIQQAPGYMA